MWVRIYLALSTLEIWLVWRCRPFTFLLWAEVVREGSGELHTRFVLLQLCDISNAVNSLLGFARYSDSCITVWVKLFMEERQTLEVGALSNKASTTCLLVLH